MQVIREKMGTTPCKAGRAGPVPMHGGLEQRGAVQQGYRFLVNKERGIFVREYGLKGYKWRRLLLLLYEARLMGGRCSTVLKNHP